MQQIAEVAPAYAELQSTRCQPSDFALESNTPRLNDTLQPLDIVTDKTMLSIYIRLELDSSRAAANVAQGEQPERSASVSSVAACSIGRLIDQSLPTLFEFDNTGPRSEF